MTEISSFRLPAKAMRTLSAEVTSSSRWNGFCIASGLWPVEAMGTAPPGPMRSSCRSLGNFKLSSRSFLFAQT
ncbi:hypothetical protein D9M69_584170 [compost metagenome]